MPRKIEDDQEKTRHNIHLFKGDYDELAVLHPDLPPALVIRQIVHKHILSAQESRRPKVSIKVPNDKKPSSPET
jgi:hypothetical protein